MRDKRRSWLVDVASYSPLAIIGGALLGYVSSGFKGGWHVALHGAFIGFFCFAGAIAGEFLFRGWLSHAPQQWWRRALVYFIGGQVAFPIAFVLGLWLIWRQPLSAIRISRTMIMIVVISGAVGTFVGLAAHGYEQMKDHLRTSIVAEQELELAREFQSRLLPAPDISADGYRITGRNLPARYVAGDFYDVFSYDDGAVGIAIADVAGKGVAASLIMASVKAVLPLLAAGRDVADAMDALNQKLARELGKREFVALAMTRFDPKSGRVSIANAGLPDPYIVRRNKTLETLVVPGPRLPLGLKREIRYEQSEATLQEGDSMFLFSDGLPEAAVTESEQLGYERLAEIIRETRAVDEILARVEAMTTSERDDDQTIVMLERRRGERASRPQPAAVSAGDES